MRAIRDGKIIWVSTRSEVLRDADGHVVALRRTVQDITEHKRTEEALRESEKKFRTVFEQAAIGIGRVSFTDARWIDINEAFCRMLGYSHEELSDLPWPEITHSEDIDLDLIPFHRLEEFAWITVHDLQEPLRKIQTFGDRLQKLNRSLDRIARKISSG